MPGKKLSLGFVLAVGWALLAGCNSQAGLGSPEATLPKDEVSAGFVDRIAAQQSVSENDAMRGVLMLLEWEDAAATFQQRVDELRRRGVVAAGWSFQADRPITRGRLAYMLYQALDVPGGVTLALTGPSQRYCLRELQYQGFIADSGTMFGQVTGMEYVGVLTRADAYLQTGSIPETILTTPAVE